MCLLSIFIYRRNTGGQMKRIGYKQGYRIVIGGNFYEVIDGKTVTHFGTCRKNSTIQEIANKTFLLDQEERENVENQQYGGDVKKPVRDRLSGRNQTGIKTDGRKNATCL